MNHWHIVWTHYKKNKVGVISFCLLLLFCLIGIYAPLLASSKPLLIRWKGTLYFPLFRYLFYTGFYTKPIDLFFNILMFTLPIACLGFALLRKKGRALFCFVLTLLHCGFFYWVLTGGIKNPAHDASLLAARRLENDAIAQYKEDPLLAPFPPQPNWEFEMQYLPTYHQINQLIDFKNLQQQQQRLSVYQKTFEEKTGRALPTLWQLRNRHRAEKENELQKLLQMDEERYQAARLKLPSLMEAYRPFSLSFIMARYALLHPLSPEEKESAVERIDTLVHAASALRMDLDKTRRTVLEYQKNAGMLRYTRAQQDWLEKESRNLQILIPPLLRTFHWEEDAGGSQDANQYVPWWELTRVNRKDLLSSLLFGIRVSLVVGTMAVALSLLIGIPLGIIAGYFAGKTDLVICRIIEMWEAMPTFFMLLLVVAITQSKSIFIVVTVLGVFGWTSFSRFIRSEVLKQRRLPYVEACRSLGYTDSRIMFSHIFPNALPPILTLLPFSLMAAITSEAGLSFLGLGEEGSTSWGVLMDEGRSAFPAESYLLWPPAILLTLLLIAIALAGDAFRDALDPKMST